VCGGGGHSGREDPVAEEKPEPVAKEMNAARRVDGVAAESCALTFVFAQQLKRKVGCRVPALASGKLAVIRKSTRRAGTEDAYTQDAYKAICVQAGLTFVNKRELDTTEARERMAIRLSGRLARFAAMLERDIERALGENQGDGPAYMCMVGFMWILVTRREFYADASKEALRKKLRRYGIKPAGWEPIVA